MLPVSPSQSDSLEKGFMPTHIDQHHLKRLRRFCAVIDQVDAPAPKSNVEKSCCPNLQSSRRDVLLYQNG